MIFPRDRGQNFNVDYEDSDASFGNGFQEDYLNYADSSGITSLPIQQPVIQPIAQPIVQPIVQPVAPVVAPQPEVQQVEQPVIQQQPLTPFAFPVVEQVAPEERTGVFGLPSVQPVAPPVQPEAPVGPDPKAIDALTNQILGQGLTGKWSGEGFGSAEKNAADMARILAGIGITDIKQFGKFTQSGIETEVRPDGQGGFLDDKGNPVDPSIVKSEYQAGESGDTTTYTAPVGTQEVFGNKVTKQAVPNTYSERQTGNFFGGTFSGKGNTGYGVQFDSQGNPIFYTQGASSNDLAQLIKDLGPIGQIALAAATGGMSLPAQLATNAGIQLLAGGNLGDIVKGTALSYLGGQAGNLVSGSSGITDLLGKTGTDIASRTAQQFVGSGGEADLGQALLGNVVGSGVNSVIGELPGLDSLSATDKNLTSNLIAAVATGTPIDQAIQNALVGKASSEARSAVAEARNAAPAPQTYEEMMAGIMPKTPDQPSVDTGPSNDDILRQIGAEDLMQTLSEPVVSQPVALPSPDKDLDSLLAALNLSQAPDTPTTEPSTQASDSLINQAATDTLGTETQNAEQPAVEKDKAMDDIDFSQVAGDYGPNLLNELRNSITDTGNASSLFSGDGGIDLSALATNAGDEDQAAPPANIADLLKNTTFTSAADESPNNTFNWQAFYDLDLTDEEKAKRADLMGSLPAQDLGISQAMIDEFNKNYQPAGGFGSQWQTYGSDRIMINDDGTGIGINTETGNQYALTPKEVQSMIDNKMLNTKASGYVAATGGTGSRPGGSKPSASTAKAATKPAAKPGTSPGTNNNNMIMALIAMMAMMNSRGGGKSSAASVIPALSANRSQLPYGPSSGAPAARPGAGGVNYFTPMSYTPKAAGGGLMSLAGGGMSNLGGYSDGGRLLRGPGDGVSDSIPATIGGKQPARLAEGEFVVPARIVSELGNGSTDAGAQKLYAMMDRVQNVRRKTKNVASNTKAHKYLPA